MLSSELAKAHLVKAQGGIAAVIGPPGPMMAWVCCLLDHVSRLSEGRVELMELQGGADSLPKTDVRRILIGHDGLAIERAVVERECQVLVVFDDLLFSVEYMCAAGAPFLDALRVHSAMLALAPALRDNPVAAYLTRRNDRIAAGAVNLVTRQLGLELAPAALSEIYGWLAIKAPDTTTFPDALSDFCLGYDIAIPNPGNLSPAQRQCVRDGLTSIMELAGPPPWSPITWSFELFSIPGEPVKPAEAVIELVGPPRCLLMGPYFHLPRGRYEVQFVLGVSTEAEGMTFAIELHDFECIARVQFKPSGDGIYRGLFFHEQTRPEIRIGVLVFSEDSAIDGHLAFSNISFHSLDKL